MTLVRRLLDYHYTSFKAARLSDPPPSTGTRLLLYPVNPPKQMGKRLADVSDTEDYGIRVNSMNVRVHVVATWIELALYPWI